MSRLAAQLLATDVSALDAGYSRAVAARRLRALAVAGVIAVCALLAAQAAEVRPGVLFDNIGHFTRYFWSILHLDSGAPVWTSPADWFWNLSHWLRQLGETLLIAYVATLGGGIAAFLLGAVASRNLTRTAWLRFTVRRLLEFARTVPDLVFALVFVVAFGLGAVPGVLAIGLHTMGTLGKLFAEVVENCDAKPIEGVAAAGGGWWARLRFGVVPQVASEQLGYLLLRFEINVRQAAIIGFVGAGGIGETLLEAIRKFYYSDVSAVLVLIIGTVMLIDYATEKLRHHLLDAEVRA